MKGAGPGELAQGIRGFTLSLFLGLLMSTLRLKLAIILKAEKYFKGRKTRKLTANSRYLNGNLSAAMFAAVCYRRG